MKPLRAALLTVAVFAVCVAPVPAAAQIGGLLKKATKKATTQYEGNTSQMPNSAFGPPLTAQSLPAALRGLEAQQSILVQRDAVAARSQSLSDARDKLMGGHDADQRAYTVASDKWNGCIEAQLDKMNEQRSAAGQAYAQSLATDPAKLQQFQKDLMATQIKAQQMIAKGDTAGGQALMQNFARQRMGGSGTASTDSASARQTCGAQPAKPAWMVQSDADWDRITALSDTIRALETKADSTGATTAGMSAEEFANARERIMYWYMSQKDGQQKLQFKDPELQLFAEHKAEIMKLDRVL